MSLSAENDALFRRALGYGHGAGRSLSSFGGRPMTYHHTVTLTPEGWRFQTWLDGEIEGRSTPMKSHRIADTRGQAHADMLNFVPEVGVGIESQLAELGL